LQVVYLPATSTPQFQSFACPLTNLHDSHVSTPLFGPNVWQAVVQPVSGGGLPSTQAHIEISLTFKDGGAYDFHTNFERIKERFLQAVGVARESDVTVSNATSSSGPMAGLNMDAVHLDDLPTYQDSGRDELAPQPAPAAEPPRQPPVQQEAPAPSFEEVVGGRIPEQRQSAAPPTDAPPGYEETQQQSIQQELEARLAKGS
jgi:WW domain-binding protein 2